MKGNRGNNHGRALSVLRTVEPGLPLEKILEQAVSCASDLSDTSHFHLDLFGNYIPGLCSGLAIDGPDLGRPLDPEKYPLLQHLYADGIKGLYRWAADTHGFEAPPRDYVYKCDLCTEIRTYLVNHPQTTFTELKPKQFYSLRD